MQQWARDVWSSRTGRMIRGALTELWRSSPIAGAVEQTRHNLGLLETAERQIAAGDHDLAASTLLEIPEQSALALARIPLAPIYAALSIPASVETAMNSEADPEDRGAAVVKGAQGVATVAAALTGSAKAVRSKFGSGKSPHVAQVTVTRGGAVTVTQEMTSGTMTTQEAALGFPRSILATHTEARAARAFPLQPGDIMDIRGSYPPCPSCKGAMNRAAAQSGAMIRYHWNGETWTSSQ